MTRRRIILVLIGATTLASAFIVTALAQSNPTYFVDGARATGEGEQTSSDHDGCVPYSAERSDVLVCSSDAPSDYAPPPEPYFDAQICDSATSWLKNRDELRSVDIESCLVQQTVNGGAWMVLFKGTDGGPSVFVPYDPTGQQEGMAHS
jgi:hypothetical protein